MIVLAAVSAIANDVPPDLERRAAEDGGRVRAVVRRRRRGGWVGHRRDLGVHAPHGSIGIDDHGADAGDLVTIGRTLRAPRSTGSSPWCSPGTAGTTRCAVSPRSPPSSYEPFDVIVVDNGSIDGSADAVEAAFPDAVVIRLEPQRRLLGRRQRGHRGRARGGADAVLLLNNDMVVEPGFLGPLVERCVATRRRGGVQPDPLRRTARPGLVRGRDRSSRAAAITGATSASARRRCLRRGLPTRSIAPAAARC